MTLRQVYLPGGGSVGTTNTRTDIAPGIALSQRFELDSDDIVTAGVAMSQGPIAATVPQSPGVSVAPRSEGTPLVSQSPGIGLTQRFAQSSDRVVTPAFEVVQVKYELTKLVGANAATQTSSGGRSDWATITNAQGDPNGTNATFAGNATGARGGNLVLDYANVTGKTDLAISLVELRFYGAVAGTALNNADVLFEYALGGTFTNLETITGDATFSATPKSHDITAAIGGDWAKIDALTVRVQANAALGETWTASIDAVILRVLASVTDAL